MGYGCLLILGERTAGLPRRVRPATQAPRCAANPPKGRGTRRGTGPIRAACPADRFIWRGGWRPPLGARGEMRRPRATAMSRRAVGGAAWPDGRVWQPPIRPAHALRPFVPHCAGGNSPPAVRNKTETYILSAGHGLAPHPACGTARSLRPQSASASDGTSKPGHNAGTSSPLGITASVPSPVPRVRQASWRSPNTCLGRWESPLSPWQDHSIRSPPFVGAGAASRMLWTP